MPFEVDPGDRSTVLAHYYRAMVGRADVWRTRMDSTTNWAIVATAGIVTFTLGDPGVHHFVLFIASLLTMSFLLLEARRLTFYRLWQRRALLLEKTLLQAAFRSARSDAAGDALQVEGNDTDATELESLAVLEAGLGRTVPEMSLGKAVARRLRRIYLYIFGVQLIAWALKLGSHPTSAMSVEEIVERAGIAGIAGPVVVGVVTGLLLAGIGVAARMGGPMRKRPAS